MRRMRLALLAPLLFVGCWYKPPVSTRVVMTPDGYQGVAITCRSDYADCIEAAGAACPAGYVVLDRNAMQGSKSVTTLNPYFNQAYTNTEATYTGQMLIQCRAGGGVQAQQPGPG